MSKSLFFLCSFLVATSLLSEERLSSKQDWSSELKEILIKKSIEAFHTPPPCLLATPVKESLPSPWKIEFKNPSYKEGILQTSEGGIIRGKDLRIQAQKIQYLKKRENGQLVHKIYAEGDLLICYKDRIFVGKRLDYDLSQKKGIIYEGKTFSFPWYLGGDEIRLAEDGSYQIKNVFITTCENMYSSWDIHANLVKISKNDQLEAKKVRFRFFNIPALWLPSFKVNLKKYFSSSPLVRSSVGWDKGSGPKISFRYQVFSVHDFALFGRLDYRLKRGFGGAIETMYHPADQLSVLDTKSYLATDVLPNDPKNKRRYRLQGLYQKTTPSDTTHLHISWDKFSDIHMPGDFKSEDFEIGTAKQTHLTFHHREPTFITSFYAHPRVNPFETLKQDLPTFYWNFHPKVFRSGIISDSFLKTSFLYFSYSNKIDHQISNFHSARFDLLQELYRPFRWTAITVTPKIGLQGIFYSHSPEKKPVFLGAFHYHCLAETLFFKNFQNIKHLCTPYLEYEGWITPTIATHEHYIFNIQDGFHQINFLKIGVKNQLFPLKHSKGFPLFEADLFTRAFFWETGSFTQTFPKAYANFFLNLASLSVASYNGWNLEKQLLDFSNLQVGWTFNEDFAVSAEFRHRSPFDWRKADPQNFILDLSRSETLLRHSPLSDRRNTFLTKAFIRLNPYWTCYIETHQGWLRKIEPPYHEFKIDFVTFLSAHWKLRFSYEHTQTDDKISGVGIFLLK